MISLLNRICRGIEDAWTSGFIQALVLVLIAYGVVSRVVNERNDAKTRIQLEQQYNVEHHTNIHLETEATQFHLGAALWDEALPIIIMGFIVAYEIKRRRKSRPTKQSAKPAQVSG